MNLTSQITDVVLNIEIIFNFLVMPAQAHYLAKKRDDQSTQGKDDKKK